MKREEAIEMLKALNMMLRNQTASQYLMCATHSVWQ